MTIKWESHLELDKRKLADIVSTLAVGEIKLAAEESEDARGQPYEAYSESYLRTLARIGESPTPDLRRTGRMLDSIRRRRLRIQRERVTITLSPAASQRTKADYLNRRRQFMGLRPKAVRRIAKAIERSSVLRSRPGPPR